MKRKEAIEKIKALWPKDAVHAQTKAEAYQILELMMKINDCVSNVKWVHIPSIEEKIKFFLDYYHDYKSSTCYTYDKNNITSDNNFTGVWYGSLKWHQNNWYTIHKASDFLGLEEEENTFNYKFMEETEEINVEYFKKHLGLDKETNLHSSVNQMGETVTQIIHFSWWNKRTIDGVITSTIKQGEMTKFKTTKGVMWMINTSNVDCVEIFTDKQ